jgi:hypothetical protein
MPSNGVAAPRDPLNIASPSDAVTAPAGFTVHVRDVLRLDAFSHHLEEAERALVGTVAAGDQEFLARNPEGDVVATDTGEQQLRIFSNTASPAACP